jgi:hypothetical protein
VLILVITLVIKNVYAFFTAVVYSIVKESYHYFVVLFQKVYNQRCVAIYNAQSSLLLTCSTEAVSVSIETMVMGALVASASVLVGYWLYKWLKGSGGSPSTTSDQSQTSTTSSDVTNVIAPPSNSTGNYFTDGTFYLDSAVVPANGAPDAFLSPSSPIDVGLTEVTGDALSTDSTWL